MTEKERIYELSKELFETGELFANEFVKLSEADFINKDKVKKLIELIDYQVIIVNELVQYGIASCDDYEAVYKNLYELRVMLESVV